MVKDLSVSILSYSELLTTSERIDQIVSETFTEYPFMMKLSGQVKDDVKDMTGSLGKDRTSAFTEKLAEMDAGRDSAFLALRDLAKASVNRSDAQVSAAAQVIINKIKNRGQTLYALGYSDETTALNMLFNDLDAPDVTAAIQTIGAESWYADLKNAQAAFENTYNDKVSSEAQEDYLRLREAFSKLGRHLSLMLDAAGLLQELGEPENIDAVIEQINEVITDVMTTARAHKTRQTEEESEVPAEAETQS